MLRRPRRNRNHPVMRSLIRETHVSTNDLVFPLFLMEGYNQKSAIAAMPGIYRLTTDLILKEIEYCMSIGIRSFDIFPVVDDAHKDAQATKSYQEDFFS